MASSKDAVVLDVDGHEVRVSNPEKPYFGERGIRKIDVVEYFIAVGDGILFALKDRPTTLERWPGGVFEGARISTRVDNTGDAFYQKRVPKNAPEWVPTAHITFPSGRTADEIAPDSVAVVAWCANLGTLTFHPWPVSKGDVESPDQIRIDLDPQPGTDFSDAVWVAPHVRELLARVRHAGLAEDLRRARRAHLRADPAAVDLPGGAPRGHRVRPRAGTPAARPRDDVVVEGGARREDLHRLQPDGPGPHDRLGVLDPAQAARPGLGAARLGRAARRHAVRLRRPDHARRASAEVGDKHAGLADHAFGIEPLLELAERQEKDLGLGEVPWPPDYPKMPGEPMRVQPSRAKKPAEDEDSGRMRHEVTDADTATAVGSGDVPVLATPRLIAWMEAATVRSAGPFLADGQTTVGTEIRVGHRRATPVGGGVEITATPPPDVVGRRLTSRRAGHRRCRAGRRGRRDRPGDRRPGRVPRRPHGGGPPAD